jgi:D-beta-D-heptose 7-phosphate kinase/D-beta-D-heptose 1-phosphate adenosyltransferase
MSHPRSGKVVELPALLALRAAYGRDGRSVVWTNGCFDLLHAGHVYSLHAAAALGDVFIVGLNSDASVRRLKGSGRPLVSEVERAEMLAALECVDHMLVFTDDEPSDVLGKLRPDVHSKGAEYAPPHGRSLPERAVVEAYGGRVVFLPLVDGLSTTELLRRVRQIGAEGA